MKASIVDDERYVCKELLCDIINDARNVNDYCFRSCVRVVSSTRAGMGKTLFITRMAEKLQSIVPTGHINIPVHGPVVTVDTVMQSLVSHHNGTDCIILHFDISPSVFEYPIMYIVLPIHHFLRYYGRWTLFCFHCSFKEVCVTHKVVSGGITLLSFMP